MNEAQALEALSSHLPSIRMSGAEWLSTRASKPASPAILRAYQMESVPQIKRLLKVARSAQSQVSPQASASSQDSVDADEILMYLSGLIRHETEPVIGWIRRAAHGELAERFEESRTNEAIEALRRRILGLALLADANRHPIWSSTSLLELVHASAPPEIRECIVSADSMSDDSDDDIDTDPGLLAIILGNALSNADKATSSKDRSIFVSTTLTPDTFNLQISNSFDGTSFTLEDVSSVGASTNSGGRGLGVMAMQSAAARLNYDLGLQANGGVAHFTLRGARRHA